ncbi:hypothetical protein B0T25DRAFT_454740 [Lasiosphaeria hispida]|uniref:VASt domain-containing protein n=1 Tax=Lasiosphaeria hispida TaxID=260671 RepID=A0AAJ0HIY6_9PEZI|nr:hypothetical protein B0T25DRAFT_454740 [Lasiosphaeria hispida]
MDANSNGLGKLLPRSIAAKRRRTKASSIAETVSSNDDAASRSLASQGSAGSDGVPSLHNDLRDGDAHDNTNGNDASSDLLASYDSDPESSASAPRPTAPSTQPSQAGYPTTSSPLVQAAHHLELQPTETNTSQTSQTSAASRASIFHQGSVDSLDSAASSLKQSKTGLTPPRSLSKQSSASRLRDVFRSKKSAEKSSSEERSPRTVASDTTGEPVPSSAPLDADPQNNSAAPIIKPVPYERIRRLSRGQNIEPLKAPPQTPPSAETATPLIVNTPPTPTFPVHPDREATASPRAKPDASPPGNMIAQRRSRAGSGAIGPSKLSNITPAPLTPTPESGPISPGNPAATFFSSMFSAVQNTANTLSNTIANAGLAQGGPKSRPPTINQSERDQDSVEVESSSEALPEQSMESKEPAVKTLGMGDLSLSQLGIMETPSNATSPVAARFTDSDSRARSESAPVDSHTVSVDLPAEDAQQIRPRSLYEPPGSGDRTPPQGSVYEDRSGVQRSGSIRSAIGRRRNRGSSTATHGTVSAAIAAANASFANPIAQSSTPKLTGFAVATKKRNRDFHTLFKSVPDDDYLIEDYSCALQREILAHGRLYVSEGHLCFSSNILGWVTTLVMSFDEIVAVEKRSTALVFKNGLEISTLHAKHVFASFTSRDTTYDLIIKIWKLGHPQLQSSLNGVRLEEPGGDRTEKIETASVTVSVAGSQSISASDDESEDDDDDIYDEDEDEGDGHEASHFAEAPALEAPTEKIVARKASGAVVPPTEKQDETAPNGTPTDFPGPGAHAPTDCGDVDKHYDKIIGDDIVAAPLGKVYSILFGPMSAAWMFIWLSGDQKCTDVQMEDKKGLAEDNKSRSFSYIKPLNSSIGPRQTKCMVTEQLENLDLEKSVNVLCSTQNPDVPSGNIFVVKTRYCLTWAENNSTRVQINCTIEWSGKSWLKGAIERGANDGQTQYCKDLFVSLKAAVSSRPRSGTLTNGAGVPKGKKRLRKGKLAQASNTASDIEGLSKMSAKSDWGLFQPVHPFLGPLVGAVKPILTGNVVYGLLVGLLVASWFGFGSNRQAAAPFGRDIGYVGYPQRLAAYEEMWRAEESDLWDWIEERAGLDRLGAEPLQARKKPGVEPRTVEEKLREEKMDEREIREAIRVTEEHLKVLKAVVDKELEGK